ncbi:MAG: tRNA pseudouridine(38-40) synthase TruA [Bacilli bacterium]|nr:tRNA pseudouridine(38-40) synthase TruA [Bacilli bacterium]
MKYLARICYDGSHFEGFQRLKNGCGVQNELERVLSLIQKREVQVKGAGRTDAGVHALDQCISFELVVDMDESKLKYVLNRSLCPYISVNSIEKVDENFHARFSVKEKVYLYKIYVGEKNPFLENYTYHALQKIDIGLLKKVGTIFVGTHDFRNFVSGERDDYVSTIFDIQVQEESDFIYLEFHGSGFYRYMVRSLVGAMIDVSLGKVPIDCIAKSLEYPDIEKRFFVAPASGLYLKKVEYFTKNE